jgi:hypothetical protein
MQTANIHRPGPGDCLPLRTQDNEGRRIVGPLGHSTGGRPGERLIRRLAMPISDDTILRHLKRYASWVDDEPPARIIGINDWSWRNRGATARSSLISNAERPWTAQRDLRPRGRGDHILDRRKSGTEQYPFRANGRHTPRQGSVRCGSNTSGGNAIQQLRYRCCELTSSKRAKCYLEHPARSAADAESLLAEIVAAQILEKGVARCLSSTFVIIVIA